MIAAVRVVRRCGLAVLLGAGCLALLPSVLCGQQVNGQGAEEIRLLREATTRERAGDLEGAQLILQRVLARRPGSVSALLSYERVLRAQGRLELLVPAATRLLDSDPTSTVGNQMRVRTLSALDRVPELEAATEAWMDAMPDRETPYREVAQLWMDRGDPARAAAVLERGRDRLGRDDALALELGNAHAALGDHERAAREWSRAIGEDGRGASLVRRRLAGLPDGGSRVVPTLVEALAAGATPGRQRAAVGLAIEAGRGDLAGPIARELLGSLPSSEREGFLVEVARRADGAMLPALAYWAYGRLVEDGAGAEQMLAIRSRLGELALSIGDTAAASRHYAAVEASYAAGSPERRKAAALRVELTAREGRLEDALAELERYRDEYPEALELDALVAAVGGLLLRDGRLDDAERLATGVRGPGTAQLRGRIALHRGDVAQARTAFLSAAPGLRGAEATEVIALATLLGRLSPAGAEVLGRALVLAERGATAQALEVLREGSGPLAASERAALLDHAAGVAERAGMREEAERVRRVIVSELSETREAPAALLGLARELARRPAGHEEARRLLERLVLEYPRSALVPQARRDLAELPGGG